MQATLYDQAGAEIGTVDLDEYNFGIRPNIPVMHQMMVLQQANARQGTSNTRTRGQVKGSTRKIYRQKGTGRSRQGSIRAPQFAGGGTVFGPTPRRYTFKVNRKERRAALRSALSVHAERGTIAVLEPTGLDEPSTKRAAEMLGDWAGGGSVLVVLADEQARVALSFRNLAGVAVLPATGAGVADIVGAAQVLVTEEALAQLTARARGDTRPTSPAGTDTAT